MDFRASKAEFVMVGRQRVGKAYLYNTLRLNVRYKEVASADKTLDAAAHRALGLIVHKDYTQILKDQGIRSIWFFWRCL